MNSDYQGIVPYLFVDDAEAAMGWYSRVFGLMVRGSKPDADERPHWIGIWVDDVDAVDQKVIAAGVACDAPVDREFGVRMLNVPDGMGHLWGFIKRTS